MNPGSSERVVFVGPTRSGKTKLARTLLRGRPNVVVVDPKHQWEPEHADRLVKTLPHLETALNHSREDGRRIVYRPAKEHLLPSNGNLLDEVARLALERKNTLLYYDELVFVANATDFWKRAPHFYFAMTTGGGLGVGLWGSVQRPSHVPMIVFTESEYRATFYLRNKSDRDRMQDTMGDDIPWSTLRRNKYAFCFADDMDTTAPLRLKFLPRAA